MNAKVHSVEPPFPPREMTEEEVRNKLYSHLDGVVRYWAEQPMEGHLEGYPVGTDLNIVRGHCMVFTMLATLDGSSIELPQFIVAPNPHPEDREYNQTQGENWFPENHNLDGYVKADLGGSLHDGWHPFLHKRLKEQTDE